MDKVTNLTGIVGLMTIGSMIATMVSVKVPLTFGTGDGVTELQGILDSIMPCLLPVCVTAMDSWKKCEDYLVISRNHCRIYFIGMDGNFRSLINEISTDGISSGYG